MAHHSHVLPNRKNSLSWTRTNDTAVNSRVLYRLSYQGIMRISFYTAHRMYYTRMTEIVKRVNGENEEDFFRPLRYR